LHLAQLLNDVDETCRYETVMIYGDNQGAIALTKDLINHQRSKHLDVQYHFIRTKVCSGRVVIEFCPTTEMVAGLMTKPATKSSLTVFRSFFWLIILHCPVVVFSILALLYCAIMLKNCDHSKTY